MANSAGAIERLWFGRGLPESIARTALLPAERLFGVVVGAREALYDVGWLRAHETAIPVVSIGNLTVGGSGKTPVAAWIAAELVSRGARPAIVLRGYGDDEPLVHRTLNPDVPVFVTPDREAAVRDAARAGADVAVLDDAFQHRRVARAADLVLVSADRWTSSVRLLPAGPWREPLRAIRRATLVIVTRKAVSAAMVELIHESLARVAPSVPRISVHLAPHALVHAGGGETDSLSSLAGADVVAPLSIADPMAFVRQLEALGARVRPIVFPDHHRFSDAEIEAIVRGIGGSGRVVCTLKDAVKLAPRWPRLGPALWYVSQQVMVERGVGGIEHVLDGLVRARGTSSPNAG